MKDLEFTDNPKIELVYDIVAGVFAIIAVLVVMLEFSTALTIEQMQFVRTMDTIIYGVFVLDFLMRIITTKNKKRFLKHNVIDFIAILPFNLFVGLQYGSAIKLIRIVTYILRLVGNVREILFTNGFIYTLILTIIITVLGSIGMYVFEFGKNDLIASYGDSLWWSFVTVSTVGYGDITPVTVGGRVIGVVLMTTGLGFLGMFTGTISTYFFSKLDEKKIDNFNAETKILDISSLSVEKQQSIINYYEYLKSNPNQYKVK